MARLIKSWPELVGLENDEYRLEIDAENCFGYIIRKSTGENVEYLSTHTFYGGTYKYYTYWLQKYGFDVQLENWDGKTEEINYSDQWLHEGKCDACRKKKYCKNECRPAKERMRNLIGSVMHERLFGRGN